MKKLNVDLKNRNYGTYIKNGIEYVRLIPRYQIPFYKLTCFVQWSLWKCGINWHNIFFDECTLNGNCCIHKTGLGE